MADQGIIADAFSSAVQSEDGINVRIIFKQDENEFYFQCRRGALEAFLPHLVFVATPPSGSPISALSVSSAEVFLDTRGEAVLTLIGTAGARYNFGLPLQVLQKMAVELTNLLDGQSPSNRAQ